MNDGKLVKVKILSFKNKELDVPADEFKEFELPINPESYSQNFKVEYEASSGQGNQKTDPKYKSTAPEELKLDFYLDGTGTVEGYVDKLAGMPVPEQVDLFLKTVYNMDGEIHAPKRLKINWGSFFVFDCILTNLDINYTLFHPDGEPLRAKLSATFLNYIEQEKRVKREDKESPDLTHVRLLQGGDSLALMSYRAYGDTNLYLQVTRANELTTFRNLPEGTELLFPPIAKPTL